MKTLTRMHKFVKYLHDESMILASNTTLSSIEEHGLPKPAVGDIVRGYAEKNGEQITTVVEVMHLCISNEFIIPVKNNRPPRLAMTTSGHDFIDTFIGMPVGKWSASLGKHGSFFNFAFGVLAGIGIQIATFIILNFLLGK